MKKIFLLIFITLINLSIFAEGNCPLDTQYLRKISQNAAILEKELSQSISKINCYAIAQQKISFKSDKTLLEAYNTLYEMLELTNVKYYSHRNGQEKILFKEAYTIDKSEKKIPDYKFKEIPKEKNINAYLFDTSFRDLFLKIHYKNLGNLIYMEMKNYKAVEVFKIKGIEKENLLIAFIIEKKSNEYVLHTFGVADIATKLYSKKRLTKSLEARISAINKYFKSELEN